MGIAAALATVVLSAAVLAQEPSKPNSTTSGKSQTAVSCGGGHTVDDYLAEKDKLRKARNKNPLPGNTCIWGWCRDTGQIPTSHPPEEVPPPAASPSPLPSQSGESSSKPKA